MKKNRFKHCLLMLLMLAFSSSVAAQNQQLTVKQLKEKAGEAYDNEDYKEAAKWYRMAAEKGDLSSQELLSSFLENGNGVEKNEGEALMWLTKAAEAGSASAQMTLARKYKEGKMVAQSYEEAIRWYEKAAKKNKYAIVCLKEIYEKLGSQSDAAGLYNLGKLYHAENAYQEAAKWYLMSAEKGNTDAMNRLGLLHANKKEYTEAVKWYRMAAEKGHASAMYNLALNYEKGNGVAKDGQEAAKWYRMAAEKGDYDAMFRMGEMYADGNGVAKDGQEAVKWYRMAAEAGSLVASREIGNMYQIGLYVKQDYEEAKKWYAKADRQAKKSVSTTFSVIDGHEYIDLGLSVKWATCNLGASKPHEYGSYYSWGETAPKKTYTFASYKFFKDKNGNGTAINKSIDVEPGEFAYIGKDISGTQYDAARVGWGGKWRMPTKAEWQELIDNTSFQWIDEGQVIGLKLKGPNGNSIFFPACGFYREGNVYVDVTDGRYWSSTAEGEKAYQLFISYLMRSYQGSLKGHVGDWGDMKATGYRMFGCCIRPVIDK
ncbi:MAG: SEL1-like repeat protein [Prevotella sp.]|nr:SEL1-like repeat protein [Prevotella sp.]